MAVCLKVLLPIPHTKPFDYLGPEEIPVGVRVRVPWGKRTRIGITWGYGSPEVAVEKLKTIDTVLDEAPLWDERHFALLQWLSQYYHRGLGEVCFAALPKQLRQLKRNLPRDIEYALTGRPKRIPGAQQQKLITALADAPKSKFSLRALGIPAITIRAAERAGWIVGREQKPEVLLQGSGERSIYSLTDEQSHAIRAVTSHNGFGTFLLHGVTGSGKTEVYLQLIRQTIARGQQALLLVPEIALTPQTIARVQHAIDGKIALYHSNLSDSERLLMWSAAAEGRADVLIGTRSAILVPMPKLGLVIVDEEHDVSFKQQDGIRYHARDVAIKRAQLFNIPVLLGSATPSLESWHHAQRGHYRLLKMRHRPGAQTPVVWHFVDMCAEPSEEGLSLRAIRRIRKALAAGNQALVFLNRRGYAPALHCETCGWLADCRQCDARMTYHQSFQRLICHHCDRSERIPTHCPACGAETLYPVGRGTERLEASLTSQFAPYPVIRIDRDSTRRKGALLQLLDKVNQGEPALLVGTQMLAKGHHFPKLEIVLVADADGMFFSADFRAAERGLALLMQVAGRAGRAKVSGEVWIQTRHMAHPLFVCLQNKGYEGALSMISEERKHLGWPPFRHLACCTVEAIQEKDAQTCARIMADYARALSMSDVQVLGPVPAPLTRLHGRFRWQWLLTSARRSSRHTVIDAVIGHFTGGGRKAGPFSRVRWSIDVDPQEMR